MKTIDKVKAYCVINEVTMQQVSQFYRRKGDAEKWIDKNIPKSWHTEEYKDEHQYCVAEFSFNKYYMVE